MTPFEGTRYTGLRIRSFEWSGLRKKGNEDKTLVAGGFKAARSSWREFLEIFRIKEYGRFSNFRSFLFSRLVSFSSILLSIFTN